MCLDQDVIAGPQYGRVDVGLDLRAHIVAHDQPAKGTRVGIVDIEAQPRHQIDRVETDERRPACEVSKIFGG